MSGGGEDQNDPLNSAPPGKAFEEAASEYHEGLGEPGRVRPVYEPEHMDQVDPTPSREDLPQWVETAELPLKAAGRLIAGIPVLGKPFSSGARKVWHNIRKKSGSQSK